MYGFSSRSKIVNSKYYIANYVRLFLFTYMYICFSGQPSLDPGDPDYAPCCFPLPKSSTPVCVNFKAQKERYKRTIQRRVTKNKLDCSVKEVDNNPDETIEERPENTPENDSIVVNDEQLALTAELEALKLT